MRCDPDSYLFSELQIQDTSAASLASKNAAQVRQGCDLIRLYAKPTAAQMLWEYDDERVIELFISDLKRNGALCAPWSTSVIT
jgi:hypothetical protein